MHDSIISIIDSITFLEQRARLKPYSSGPGRVRHRTWRLGRGVCFQRPGAGIPDASAAPAPSRHKISTGPTQARVGTGFPRRTARGAVNGLAQCRVIGAGSPRLVNAWTRL